MVACISPRELDPISRATETNCLSGSRVGVGSMEAVTTTISAVSAAIDS